jgi:hypothetical protein
LVLIGVKVLAVNTVPAVVACAIQLKVLVAGESFMS